ncbi:MAG: hypothetical protein V7K16_15110 [Nostoc sp.]
MHQVILEDSPNSKANSTQLRTASLFNKSVTGLFQNSTHSQTHFKSVVAAVNPFGIAS